MARKYVLRDSDGYDPLSDPHAAWRKDPASERQIRRIEFFTGRRIEGLTKGKAGAIIDKLNEDTKRLADYERWKQAGEPDIQKWRREHGASSGAGCFAAAAVLFGRVSLALAVVLIALCALLFFLNRNGSTGVVVSPTGEPKATPAKMPIGVRPTSPMPAKATPRPIPTGASAIAAQRRAMATFPELAVKDSPLNKAFVERVRRYQNEKPEIFDNPDWPSKIAVDAFRDLK